MRFRARNPWPALKPRDPHDKKPYAYGTLMRALAVAILRGAPALAVPLTVHL